MPRAKGTADAKGLTLRLHSVVQAYPEAEVDLGQNRKGPEAMISE
jgi:hypothetical protein